MNRLGILVDLSHASDETALQALKHSQAPLIWSHSSARAVRNVARNVPDDILQLLGAGAGQKDGVVMVCKLLSSLVFARLTDSMRLRFAGQLCAILHFNSGECISCSRCRSCRTHRKDSGKATVSYSFKK